MTWLPKSATIAEQSMVFVVTTSRLPSTSVRAENATLNILVSLSAIGNREQNQNLEKLPSRVIDPPTVFRPGRAIEPNFILFET